MRRRKRLSGTMLGNAVHFARVKIAPRLTGSEHGRGITLESTLERSLSFAPVLDKERQSNGAIQISGDTA